MQKFLGTANLMRNFKVKMAYDGSAYHGFQRQNNALSIQEVVEEAIKKLFLHDITIFGCSRTDTGVHANEYYFSFVCEEDIKINPRGIIFGLNSKLPDDIAILDCEEASEDFHARYNCKGKEYKYIIHNSEIKDPFLRTRVYKYWYPIDERLLDKAAKHFVGTHDFKSFCSSSNEKENTVRTIYSFDVKRDNDKIIMTVSGDGFLYNMVRIMVGTLLFVNEKKISESDIPEIINKKDRKYAGRTASASGLYLNKVYY